MSQTNWEADKMLDVYIYDYFVKRKLHNSAKAFQQEGKVSTDPVAIDAPGGFLFEWWSVFWDIFIARSNEKHSEAAASYIETQISKAREQQQKSQQQHNNMQIQHLLMQRQQQQQQQQQHQQQQHQQRRDGTQLLNGSANGIPTTDPLMRQNPGTANALAAKMYEEKLKPPLQRDPCEDPTMKLVDPNHASLLKSASVGGQGPGQGLHATGGISGNMQQFQNRNQQLPLSVHEIKSEMNLIMNARATGPEASLTVPGSNQGGNSSTLKGWPLSPMETIRPQLVQQKPLIQSPQPFHNYQFQQHILLQAQQNLASPSAMDFDNRKPRMFLNNRNMSLGKDGQLNHIGEVGPNVGSPVQIGCPIVPRGDADMLIKQQMQSHLSQQQNPQVSLSNSQSQITDQVHQSDKMGAVGGMTMDPSVANPFRGNDQASKNQMTRKRKQPVSSSGPANSSGTANTAGPSPSSAPSTPSTHTPGDVMSMPSLPHNGGSSKPSMIFGSDSAGTLAAANNQLADVGRFVDDTTVDDNVESFLSQEEGGDPRESMGRGMDISQDAGFIFKDIALIPASTNKVNCCHFSSDGKLLATGGHDKKAVLWLTETWKPMSTLEEHTHVITDVRFAPNMSRLATSSFDRTVRVWDAENPTYTLRNFTGHSTSVMSVDFHPNKDDLICSCDGNGEIRYWSITHGSCMKVFEGGMTQVRFQPRHGKYLAAAAESYVNIIDAETQVPVQKLQGHTQKVISVCWDDSGELVASVSEDLVRVWAVGSGSKWQCIHELNCNGNKFTSCVFHPVFPQLLVIGCYQNLEVWSMAENQSMTVIGHEGLITSLAASPTIGLVASASHDKFVKIWK